MVVSRRHRLRSVEGGFVSKAVPQPSQALNPGYFAHQSSSTSHLVKLPMVASTERDGELIADLKTNGSWSSKAQMMRIRRVAARRSEHGREATNFSVPYRANVWVLASASWPCLFCPRLKPGAAGAKDGAAAAFSFVFVRSDRRNALMEFWCRRPERDGRGIGVVSSGETGVWPCRRT